MSWKAGKISFTFFSELDIKKMNRFCISIEKEVEIVYKIYQRDFTGTSGMPEQRINRGICHDRSAYRSGREDICSRYGKNRICNERVYHAA